MAYSLHTRLDAPPAAETEKIQVLGLPNARFFVDRSTEAILQEGLLAVDREVASVPPGPNGERPPANFLELSGGGEKGAFGAGLMVGWSESGQRPEFKLVTGVSTGALLARLLFWAPLATSSSGACSPTSHRRTSSVHGGSWRRFMTMRSPIPLRSSA